MLGHRNAQRKAALDKALIELIELSPTGLRVCAEENKLAEELGRNIHSLLATPITQSRQILASLGLSDVPLTDVKGRLDAFEIALTGVGARRCVLITLTVERAFTNHALGWTVSKVVESDDPTTSCVLTSEQSKQLGFAPM